MPRQGQFPVQLSDNRHCYRASSTPGFVISLALVAALAGYAGLSHAAPPEAGIAAPFDLRVGP